MLLRSVILLCLNVCDYYVIIIFLLDLDNLHTIVFNGSHVLAGDNRPNRKATIKNVDSYDNELVLRGMLPFTTQLS